MTTQKITVGILAPSAETRESMAGHVEATGLASVKVTVDQYCAVEDDHPTQRFLDARPDIILVDMEDQRAAIMALFTLHAVLPEANLYACSSASEPQLIIETMQAGAREFLAKPVSARGLSLAFGRYLDEKQRLRSDVQVRGKIYAVTAAKGGAGATSVAVNLATTLSGLSETRVALIDMNTPVGDAASYLNIKPQFSISDALAAAPKLDPVLLQTFMSKAHDISVLSGAKSIKPGPAFSAASLAKLWRVVSQTFTHTFIDLPPSLDQELLQTTSDASEVVLVVMTPELPAVWRTHRLIHFLAGIGCAERMRLILNRDNSRDDINEREISRALNHPIYWRLPNNYGSAIEAINKGKPIVSVNHSGLSASYRKLTHDLTGIPVRKQRRGIMKLFQ